MLLCRSAPGELRRSKHVGIYFAAEPIADAGEKFGDLPQTDLANYQQIDIAFRARSLSGHRPEYQAQRIERSSSAAANTSRNPTVLSTSWRMSVVTGCNEFAA